ncbi:hypothetical protein [Ascidiimonas aurantiaca]|uniref:hypothetical protein n=1 Tax=Ascidiimonas aurantiaca TaxID=1685432 RepID=UPI0030ED1D7A
MDKNHTIKLIEGAFSPSEAADILFNLLSEKIKFHEIKLLNIKEYGAYSTEHSAERIKALKQAKKDISKLLIDARDEDAHIVISGNIDIKLVRP